MSRAGGVVGLVLMVLSLMAGGLPAPARAAYQPPAGIPAPSFGMEEVAGPATRTTLATTLPAGTIVELPPGPAPCSTYTAQGTASAPVVIRGADPANPPRFTCNVIFAGSYLIVERIEVTGAAKVTLAGDHLALRQSHVHHHPGTGAHLWACGTDLVIYQIEQSHNGNPDGSSGDRHGIGACGATDRLWVLDSEIHHNSGDGIQFCHKCAANGAPNDGPGAVYIGRNRIHDDHENALDLKEFRGPVIVSENELYNYQDTSTSNGEPIRVNDEGLQGSIWIIENAIHAAEGACIASYGSQALKHGTLHAYGNTMANCGAYPQDATLTPPPTPIVEPAPPPAIFLKVRLLTFEVTVAWETAEDTRGQIAYGDGQLTPLEASYRRAHARTIEGSPGTGLTYRLRAKDRTGRWYESADVTLTLPGP